MFAPRRKPYTQDTDRCDTLATLVLESDKKKDWDAQDIYIEALQDISRGHIELVTTQTRLLGKVALRGVEKRNELIDSAVLFGREPAETALRLPYFSAESLSFAATTLGRRLVNRWSDVFEETILLQHRYATTVTPQQSFNFEDFLGAKQAQDTTLGALGRSLCINAGIAAPHDMLYYRSRISLVLAHTEQGLIYNF